MDVSTVTRNAETAAANTQSSTGTVPVAEDALANRETFLQLLVAQIKNQDPLNPTDSVQFLTQLAQFSQLEQLIGIRQDLTGIGTELAANNDAQGEASSSA